MIKSLLLLTSLLIVSCNKNNSPEGVLSDFVNYRFTSSQSKDDILSYLTEPLFSHYSQMTEEEFKVFSNLTGYKKKRLKINFKNCSETECSITYTVKFQVTKSKRDVTLGEVRRIAKVIIVDEEWKISDITNEGSKTHFEGKSPITPEDFKTEYKQDVDSIKLDNSGNIQYDENGKAMSN